MTEDKSEQNYVNIDLNRFEGFWICEMMVYRFGLFWFVPIPHRIPRALEFNICTCITVFAYFKKFLDAHSLYAF